MQDWQSGRMHLTRNQENGLRSTGSNPVSCANLIKGKSYKQMNKQG